MILMKTALVFFGALIFSSATLAAPSSSRPPVATLPALVIAKENCVIVSYSKYKNGDKKEDTKAFNFKTKAECVNMKKILSDNFSPREIKTVSAVMTWRGGK